MFMHASYECPEIEAAHVMTFPPFVFFTPRLA